MSVLEALSEQGIINRYQSQEISEYAEDKHDGDINAALADYDIDEESILDAKSTYYDIPKKEIDSNDVSFELLQYIPEDSARYYKFVPIGKKDEVLQVGIVDPANMEARNALQFITANSNIQYELYVISEGDFNAVLQNYGGVSSQIGAAQKEVDNEVFDENQGSENEESSIAEEETPDMDKEAQAGASDEQGKNAQKIVEDAPVTKTVAVILRHAVEGRASDVHVEHTGEKVKVRFRVDGTLYTSLYLPKNVHSAIVARVKILAKLKLDEKRKPQDGRFHAKINNRKIDFRVSTLPTYNGEKVVIRILDPEKGIKDLDETGMRDEHLQIVKEAVQAPYGMVLLTGPTGSGKTTTLYAMLQELDREGRNVVSLEDPIEYNITGMNQSQVRPEIDYTFANGLRSILRQDPDVIMVGEIRDKETAELAIQAALTGHLVFSTLHTNNSFGVIPRLIDMGVDPYLIAPTLQLAIAQRLVKKLCPEAKKEKPIEGSIKEMMDEEFKDLPQHYREAYKVDEQQYVYEPGSTDECPSGYKGRKAIFEMFRMNDELEKIVLDSPSEDTIYEALRKQGMLTIREDAILKAMNGEIPFSEVNTV